MAVNLPINDWVAWAKISQALQADKNSKQRIFNNTISPNWPPIIRIVRKVIEFIYARNPDDESLYITAPYLKSLIDPQAITNAVCIPPVIITNPSNASVAEGAAASFTVVASGTATLTYQWQKNGVNIINETAATLSFGATVSGDAGSYRCIVSNACGQATSAAATLTVTAAALSFTIGWGTTDPFVDTSTPLTITNSQSVSFISGANLIYSGSLVAFANKFMMFSWPAGEPTPNLWSNGDPSTAINQGPIPDSFMRAVWTVGALKYTCSTAEMTLNTSLDFRLNH